MTRETAIKLFETKQVRSVWDTEMETYLRKGYSKEWINQQLKSIEIRKELTDEWEFRGVKKGRNPQPSMRIRMWRERGAMWQKQPA